MRTHIIDILEPSRTTWAILFIMGVCCFVLDGTIPLYGEDSSGSGSGSGSGDGDGDGSGSGSGRRLGGDDVHFMEQDPQDWKKNNSPTTVNFWVHVAWVLLNWLPAFGAMALRHQAKRMYMRHVDAAFKPFAQVRDGIRVTGYG